MHIRSNREAIRDPSGGSLFHVKADIVPTSHIIERTCPPIYHHSSSTWYTQHPQSFLHVHTPMSSLRRQLVRSYQAITRIPQRSISCPPTSSSPQKASSLRSDPSRRLSLTIAKPDSNYSTPLHAQSRIRA